MQTIFTQLTGLENLVSVFIKGIGIQSPQEAIFRPNGLMCFQWLYSAKGEGVVVISQKEYVLKEGCALLLFPEIEHKYYSRADLWTTYWIQFDGNMIYSILSQLQMQEWFISEVKNSKRLINSFDELLKIVSLQWYTSFWESSAKLFLFLIEFYRDMKILHTEKYRRKTSKIFLVIEYMEKQFNNNPSLEELSAIINVTPQHLCRLFHEEFHMTPFSFLIQIRLKHAKNKLIKYPQLPIKEIAASVGYSDASYFCSLFKTYEKITPTEFRNNF